MAPAQALLEGSIIVTSLQLLGTNTATTQTFAPTQKNMDFNGGGEAGTNLQAELQLVCRGSETTRPFSYLALT